MFKRIEQFVAVLTILFLSEAITDVVFRPTTTTFVDPVETNPFAWIPQILLYSLTAFYIFNSRRTWIFALKKSRWLIALMVLAVASTVWSSSTALTLRRSLVFIGTTSFGVYFGSRFSVKRQLRLLAIAFSIIAVGSCALALFVPSIGIDSGFHMGAWQGVYHQKNMLARVMVLSLLAFVFLEAKGLGRWLRVGGILLSIAMIVLSGSASAIVVVAALLVLMSFSRMLRTSARNLVPAGILIAVLTAVAGFLVASNLTSILVMLGRDPTLTGRTLLWDSIILSAQKRAWLGYGFHAFWIGMNGESSTVLMAARWAVMQAHNGFLDLWLELGVAGLGLCVSGLLVSFSGALRYFRGIRTRDAMWPLTYLAFLFLYNFSESILVRENSLFWALFAAISVSVCAIEPLRGSKMGLKVEHSR